MSIVEYTQRRTIRGANRMSKLPTRRWLVADYSQVEARIVAWAGKVTTLQRLFQSGDDVHLYVCKQIARYLQDNNIKIPPLPMPLPDGTIIRRAPFVWKPWGDFNADDHERYLAKRTVHANNYGMGKEKYAKITGLPENIAGLIQDAYFILFPEIRSGYQSWIETELRRNRTITTPQGFRKIFYDIWDDKLLRAAYAFYPQTTNGLNLVDTIVECREVFARDKMPAFLSPATIRKAGFAVKMQVHDSVNISVADDPIDIEYTARTTKKIGERLLQIRGEELAIPMDFKLGPTLKERESHEEPNPMFLQKYKLQ